MRIHDGLIVFVLFAYTLDSTTGQNTTTTLSTTILIPGKTESSAHLFIEHPQPQVSTLERLDRLSGFNATYNEHDYESFKNQTPNAVEITSENYPKPYPAKSHQLWNITVENSTGVEMVIHFLDIDPKTDFLKVLLGEDTSEDTGLILTGKLKAPLQLRSLHSPNLQIKFFSSSSPGHVHVGFLVTYIPYAEIVEPVTKPPEEVTIAPENLQTFSTLLSVPETKQNNKTWDLMKSLLCDAANNFTSIKNLTLEECRISNVSFVSIVKCPSLWPNNLDCVEITFCIQLYQNFSGIEVTEDPLNGEELITLKELSGRNLKLMWDEFGRTVFAANNFLEYKSPETKGLVLFWAGMAVSAALVFLLILVIISRLRVLRDYVKWPHPDEDNQNILKKSQDIDITMFPSPHQVVPTLFPTSTSAYSPGSSFLYGGDVYENRPRDMMGCFNETDPSLLSGLRRKSSFDMDNPIINLDGDDTNRSHQQESYTLGNNKDESIS